VLAVMCRSQDTHPWTSAARTGLTKNKHVLVCSFLFGRTSTNKSSELPKYPEDEAIIGPLAYIHMVLQLKAYIILGWKGELVSVKPLSRLIHRAVFSAECTIGMVWGLTSLKHYGNIALWK